MEKLELPHMAYAYSGRCGEGQVVQIFAGDRTLYGCRGSQTADRLNEEIGVNKAQAAAMMGGVEYGWNSPQADPNNYYPDGRYKL